MAKTRFNASTVATVKNMVPFDDVMFQKMCESRETCQEIISTILGQDIRVIDVVPQDSIENLQGRSVRLDCLCKLRDGIYVNVEVQKPDNDDHEARVRYNASVITANQTPKGIKFRDVAQVIVIYITRFDIFGDGRPIYHIDRVVRETGKVRTDGFTEIYVNAAVKNYDDELNTNVSDLMDLFTDRERSSRNSQNARTYSLIRRKERGRCVRKSISLQGSVNMKLSWLLFLKVFRMVA